MDKFKLTRGEKAWILYDVGNSAFILLISTVIPIYFNALASADGISDSDYLAAWGYAGSVSTLIVALSAPLLGTLADRRNMKPILFTASLALGALGCACLGLAWGWMSFLVIFVVAKVGYSSANVFYDAMLPEITTEARMDKVSSLGYAFGYIGSCIPFIVSIVIVLFYEKLGISQPTAMLIAFLITAVWWVVLTVPLLRTYRHTAYSEASGAKLSETLRRFVRTFKNIRREKHIFIFMLAFFFFIDGVYTIIEMATAYGTAVGLDSTGLLLALLLTQLVAFPFAILFGRLSAKYRTGLLIKICVLAYTGIAVFAIFLQHQWQFWTLAVAVGMFQGGIQALSRSYFAKIIPAEKSGEYFGLFDICGKGAAFLGTLIVAVVSQTTGNESLAVGAIAVIFVIGFAIFCYADKLNRSQK